MQQALIVDDSRTSAAVLGKMLRKHQMDVVKVESAEEALELLADTRPSIIFMDHMMPGMDGFEAVKAIKATPALSSIPIVMHTSKTGDIYVGHARALGAADILNKPATDQDLSQVLERLERNSKLSVVDSKGVEKTSPVEITSATTNTGSSVDEPQVKTLHQEPAPVSRPTIELQEVVLPAPRSRRRQIWYGLLTIIPLIWVLSLYVPTERHRQALLMQQSNYLSFLSWSLSQAGSYSLAEPALSGKRFELLDGTLLQLFSMGFKGVVRLEVHSGAFCLASVGERVVLADPELPVSDCAMLGLPAAQLANIELMQSSAFSQFIQTTPLLKGTDIRLEIVPVGDSTPLEVYPSESVNSRAGEWNDVAAKNNRVAFIIKPDS